MNQLPTSYPHTCVFCVRISRGEYDKEYPGFSFEPLNPVVAGHRLFVPPQHVVDAAVEPEVAGRVFAAAAEYARRQGHDFNLITSRGEYATQSVGHLHVHYVPRFEGDGLTLPWTGQVDS
jgi:histidine triad (HIT) family protein